MCGVGQRPRRYGGRAVWTHTCALPYAPLPTCLDSKHRNHPNHHTGAEWGSLDSHIHGGNGRARAPPHGRGRRVGARLVYCRTRLAATRVWGTVGVGGACVGAGGRGGRWADASAGRLTRRDREGIKPRGRALGRGAASQRVGRSGRLRLLGRTSGSLPCAGLRGRPVGGRHSRNTPACAEAAGGVGHPAHPALPSYLPPLQGAAARPLGANSEVAPAESVPHPLLPKCFGVCMQVSTASIHSVDAWWESTPPPHPGPSRPVGPPPMEWRAAHVRWARLPRPSGRTPTWHPCRAVSVGARRPWPATLVRPPHPPRPQTAAGRHPTPLPGGAVEVSPH